jgi:hypothetical protein
LVSSPPSVCGAHRPLPLRAGVSGRARVDLGRDRGPPRRLRAALRWHGHRRAQLIARRWGDGEALDQSVRPPSRHRAEAGGGTGALRPMGSRLRRSAAGSTAGAPPLAFNHCSGVGQRTPRADSSSGASSRVGCACDPPYLSSFALELTSSPRPEGHLLAPRGRLRALTLRRRSSPPEIHRNYPSPWLEPSRLMSPGFR